MNWTEYKILSEKTLSGNFYCSVKEELLLHAVVGVITELEELVEWKEDRVGKTEEVIDIFWYLAILAREYNIDLPNNLVSTEELKSDNSDNNIWVLSMYKLSSVLLDFLKKKLYYNKPIDTNKFIEKSKELLTACIYYALVNDIDIYKGFDTNINKLKARYGDKFSNEKAINRDVDAERAILEKGEHN